MIPVEVITLLGSSLLGGLLSIWAKSMEAKREEHSRLMDKAGLRAKNVKGAREYEGKGYQFTRRTIALAAVFAVIVLPKIATLIWPELSVYYGYTEEVSEGFWVFSSTSNVTLWEPLKGLVITPIDTHLVSAITGLYFGASVVKNS